MKLLVSLSSYGDKNINLLNTVIDEYKSYRNYDVSIELHCTVPLTRTDIHQVVHQNPPTTSFFHRQDFIKARKQFDLYLFSEYDILIKESTIDTYLKYDKILPINYSMGFIRYEDTPEKIQYLIDLWSIPSYDYLGERNLRIGTVDYFTLSNVFQSCYLFTKDKLNYVIDNMDYSLDVNSGFGVETSSANVFLGWGHGPRGIINKVVPKHLEDLQKCFIHHTANNHCNPPGVNADPMTFRSTTITKNQLFLDLNL